MCGEGTEREPMSRMYSKLFLEDARYISHLLAKNFEFKDGSHDVFTKRQLMYTSAIITKILMNWAMILYDQLCIYLFHCKKTSNQQRTFVRLINILLRHNEGSMSKSLLMSSSQSPKLTNSPIPSSMGI